MRPDATARSKDWPDGSKECPQCGSDKYEELKGKAIPVRIIMCERCRHFEIEETE